jgi:hypothetical protein
MTRALAGRVNGVTAGIGRVVARDLLGSRSWCRARSSTTCRRSLASAARAAGPPPVVPVRCFATDSGAAPSVDGLRRSAGDLQAASRRGMRHQPAQAQPRRGDPLRQVGRALLNTIRVAALADWPPLTDLKQALAGCGPPSPTGLSLNDRVYLSRVSPTPGSCGTKAAAVEQAAAAAARPGYPSTCTALVFRAVIDQALGIIRTQRRAPRTSVPGAAHHLKEPQRQALRHRRRRGRHPRCQPSAIRSSVDRWPELGLPLRFPGTAVAGRAPVASVRVLA